MYEENFKGENKMSFNFKDDVLDNKELMLFLEGLFLGLLIGLSTHLL